MKTKTLTVMLFTILMVGSTAAQIHNSPSTNMDAVLLTTDPVPVQSGDDASVTFKLVNRGNTAAEDVRVELLDSFPFKLKPDTKRNYSLGKVTPGEEYYISTDVLVADNAPDGKNYLKFRVSHGDYSQIIKVPIQVQSQNIDLNLANLKTTPSQLTADMDNAKMSVDVVNNGEKTADNVVLNLGLPDTFQATSSFSSRQALGNIKPGEIKTATFTFDVKETASKGSLDIPANLSYSTGDSNNLIKDHKSFSLYLAGRPQFEITNVSSTLTTGSKGQLKVTVKNTGTEKSGSTRIRVLDSSDLPFSYDSSSQYIGSLEPGQTGEAVFDVSTEGSAVAKSYLVDMELRGVKGTSVYVSDKTVKVPVKQGQSRSNLLYIFGGFLVVVAAIIYYFRDRIFTKKGEE